MLNKAINSISSNVTAIKTKKNYAYFAPASYSVNSDTHNVSDNNINNNSNNIITIILIL